MKWTAIFFILVSFLSGCATYRIKPGSTIDGVMVPSKQNYFIKTGGVRHVGEGEFPIIGTMVIDGQRLLLIQSSHVAGDAEQYFLIDEQGKLFSKYMVPVDLDKTARENRYIVAPHQASTIPPDIKFSIKGQ